MEEACIVLVVSCIFVKRRKYPAVTQCSVYLLLWVQASSGWNTQFRPTREAKVFSW